MEDPQSPSLSMEIDAELGQGNGGMPLEQSDDQQQQNEVVQQPQVKAVEKPSKMMAQPQMNKMNVQKANDCEEISETMHATQFGENNIDVVPKQRVWFKKKKIIACIIIIILVVIGISGGSIWYFYPSEAKKDKDELPTKRTKSYDDVKSPTTGLPTSPPRVDDDEALAGNGSPTTGNGLPRPRDDGDDDGDEEDPMAKPEEDQDDLLPPPPEGIFSVKDPKVFATVQKMYLAESEKISMSEDDEKYFQYLWNVYGKNDIPTILKLMKERDIEREIAKCDTQFKMLALVAEKTGKTEEEVARAMEDAKDDVKVAVGILLRK